MGIFSWFKRAAGPIPSPGTQSDSVTGSLPISETVSPTGAASAPIFPRDRAPTASLTHSSSRNERIRRDRGTDELIGLCRGVLADGAVSAQEAGFLLDWLERHREYLNYYPFDVLHRRISDALCDGVLDSDEERDLLDALVRCVGGEAQAPMGTSLSTALPFDDPLPSIIHRDKFFVVTGVFAFGSRKSVVEAIEQRGGVIKTAVSKKVHYLIIGEVGSREWKHSAFGRKIEKAIELRADGADIALIPEGHWAS